MKRIVREPLVHFLVLGTALFTGAALLGDESGPVDAHILVTTGKIDHLATVFSRTWQRPPTMRELEGLVNDFIREEAAYREGMAMGLDYDDTIIRRRIRQKVDFIAEDLMDMEEPTDEELQDYLNAHAEDYGCEPIFSFEQIYFKSGDDAREAEAVLAALQANPTSRSPEMGHNTLLEPYYAELTTSEIAEVFGQDFAAAAEALEQGVWQGPVASGYGVHLVRIDTRIEGAPADLADVRAAVRRDWESAKRREALERYYQSLLDQYAITVEWPQAPAEPAAP